MGLIDKLRRAGGIVKNRLASAVGALRTAARGVTVSGTRLRRGVRFGARAARLTSPVGIGLTAVSFAPEIVRGVRAAGRFLQRAIPRGAAFFATRRIIGATAGGATAAGVVGVLQSRKSGQPAPVQSFPRAGALQAEAERGFKAARPRRKAPTKRKAPTRRRARARPTARRRKARDGRKKRRTHRSPRHKGHKRVSFTTKEGKKVSFLVNPKARHR